MTKQIYLSKFTLRITLLVHITRLLPLQFLQIISFYHVRIYLYEISVGGPRKNSELRELRANIQTEKSSLWNQ